MDATRFDALTRRFVDRRLSRRAALSGAAGLLATLGLGHGTEAQVSQAHCGNKICAANPAVCNDGCVCCVYPNGNSRCRPPGTCTPGAAVCPPGQVLGPSGICVAPTTTTTTTTTTTAAPCPSGTEMINGVCFDIYPNCSPGCGGAGGIVGSQSEFLCITYVGTFCDANSFCGPGLACQYGGTRGLCVSAC